MMVMAEGAKTSACQDYCRTRCMPDRYAEVRITVNVLPSCRSSFVQHSAIAGRDRRTPKGTSQCHASPISFMHRLVLSVRAWAG